MKIDDYTVFSSVDDDLSVRLMECLIHKKYRILDTYKDDKKCYVAKIKLEFLKKYIVIKVPRSRHQRIWEQFLTIFRYGESIRQYKNFKKLIALGFNGPVPLMAVERRRKGVVVDSFIVYYYVEGNQATVDDVDLLAPEILRLHGLGYMRKDPHPENFIISQNEVFFIDFKITRPRIFKKVRCLMEYSKFLETVPEGISYLDFETSSKLQFKIARILQSYFSGFRRIRRKIKKYFFINR